MTMRAALLWQILLSVSFLVFASEDQKKITVSTNPGDTITLPCQAPSSSRVLIVEWTKSDLEEDYVFLFLDGHPELTQQHPSFKNRVDLQDRQMKDGDVSLILKNVTTADEGKYECRAVQRETNRRKRAYLDGEPIKIISLSVPPGPPGGHREHGQMWHQISTSGSARLTVGPFLSAVLVVLLFYCFFDLLRYCTGPSSSKSSGRT